MSSTIDSIRTAAAPELERLADDLSKQFLGGLKGILANADAAARDKVADLIKKGYDFKRKAITADTQEEAREYSEAVATTVRRVKTILLAEKLVAEESVAALVSNLFETALDGLATIAKGLLGTIAEGVVSGVISSIAGGGDGSFDPSSIFPFA